MYEGLTKNVIAVRPISCYIFVIEEFMVLQIGGWCGDFGLRSGLAEHSAQLSIWGKMWPS